MHCSHYENNSCRGGCTNQEQTDAYNERVMQAIDKYNFSKKSILIMDKGRETGERCGIEIKDGVFKGLGYFNLNHQINNIHILESIITPMEGNENTTHIISTYLRKKKVLKIIELKH
jgi:DNA polymerase-3 subunit epsilon